MGVGSHAWTVEGDTDSSFGSVESGGHSSDTDMPHRYSKSGIGGQGFMDAFYLGLVLGFQVVDQGLWP